MKRPRREVLGVLTAAVGSALLPGSFAMAGQAPAPKTAKETVSGIGGFFFRAHDPKGLALWYQDHLGIFVTPQKPDDPVWQGRQVLQHFLRRRTTSTPRNSGC
jgi:glyoxylase I family protein